MGYTHYWYRPETLDQTKFMALTEDIRRLIANLPEHSLSAGGHYKDNPLSIRGETGAGQPTLTNNLISFNGSGKDVDGGGDLGHETFYFERVFEPEPWQKPEENGLYFSFCKTAQKPYDLLVTAALTRVKHYFPEIQVSSDGEPKDWIEGLKLCSMIFGPESANLPLEPDEDEEE